MLKACHSSRKLSCIF